MKRVFLSLLLLACFSILKAQVQYGAKAGVNLSTLDGDDTNGYESRTGFHAGVFAEIPLGKKFSIRPELFYSLQGANTKENEFTGTDAYLKTGYIHLPVLAKYNVVRGFFIETGPQIGFLTSARLKLNGQQYKSRDAYKSTDFAWAFGLGYELASGFGFNGRYNAGLSKIDDAGDHKWRNNVFQAGIYYKFRCKK